MLGQGPAGEFGLKGLVGQGARPLGKLASKRHRTKIDYMEAATRMSPWCSWTNVAAYYGPDVDKTNPFLIDELLEARETIRRNIEEEE